MFKSCKNFRVTIDGEVEKRKGGCWGAEIDVREYWVSHKFL